MNQREVGVDTDSFADALRAALREDPDVILVGEMRDLETIQFALTIAETGHLVFATLHTNDAAQALDRISDVFPANRQEQIKVQLAASIQGVVSQRLIPKIGGGQVAAFEVLIATNAMRNLIREGKTHQIRNVVATGMKDGMRTLEASLSDLVAMGQISFEEAPLPGALPEGDPPAPRAQGLDGAPDGARSTREARTHSDVSPKITTSARRGAPTARVGRSRGQKWTGRPHCCTPPNCGTKLRIHDFHVVRARELRAEAAFEVDGVERAPPGVRVLEAKVRDECLAGRTRDSRRP